MPPRAAATLSVFLSGAVLAACAWSATARAEPVSAGTGIPPAAPTPGHARGGRPEHPWAMAFLPDGGILITERPGNLRLLRIPGGLSAPLKGVPKVAAQGQGGLLDVALSPDFAKDRLVYLSHAGPATAAPAPPWDAAVWPMTGPAWRISASCSGRSQAVRGAAFRFPPGAGRQRASLHRAGREQPALHRARPGQAAGQGGAHPGRRLGAAGQSLRGQGRRAPEIWSYGHRNPQGMALNPGPASCGKASMGRAAATRSI